MCDFHPTPGPGVRFSDQDQVELTTCTAQATGTAPSYEGPRRTGLDVSYTSCFCVVWKPVITFAEVHNSQDGAAARLAQLIGRHAGVQASVAGAAVPDPEPPRVLGL